METQGVGGSGVWKPIALSAGVAVVAASAKDGVIRLNCSGTAAAFAGIGISERQARWNRPFFFQACHRIEVRASHRAYGTTQNYELAAASPARCGAAKPGWIAPG